MMKNEGISMWLERLNEANQIQKVISMNEKTQAYGLVLTEDDAKFLVEQKQECLKEQQRIEFGETILSKLIFTFCDSAYISQSDYVETISRLQEIFYLYKNESMDILTDDELLSYMKEAFEGECQGSLEYLEETVLEEFARKIREEGHYNLEKHYKIKGRVDTDE